MPRTGTHTAGTPGGGPPGVSCRHCAAFEPTGGKNGKCGEWRKRMHREPTPIYRHAMACEFFQEKPPRDHDPVVRVERGVVFVRNRPIQPITAQEANARRLEAAQAAETPARWRHPPKMDERHAAAYVPFLLQCARVDARAEFTASSRLLDEVCEALGVEPIDFGLEPGARE
ncbi:MAG: hypothetical protein RLO01_01910 [Thalassobaculaceae bacterium]